MSEGVASRRQRIAFGDFQTPAPLAEQVCRLLMQTGERPTSIVEPTCGVGRFLIAAADAFPDAQRLLGTEIDAHHLAACQAAVTPRHDAQRFQLQRADFYTLDWPRLIAELPEPILIVGNPPWVTNSTQGKLVTDNLPTKSNWKRQRGVEALTGKSNFDISEWMLEQLLSALRERHATLAMLVKTAVARRILASAWQRKLPIHSAGMYRIDAFHSFQAAVDACLLVIRCQAGCRSQQADEFESLESPSQATRILGWRDGRLISQLDAYERCRHLLAVVPPARSPPESNARVWRSGIKHDCAAVLELSEHDGRLCNGLGEEVDVEPECLYPLLKQGDLKRSADPLPTRRLLLPQRFLGDDTSRLQHEAPRTWHYLQRHAARFAARRSTIYRGQPSFAVFGLGKYSFSPWKVAVSGLAKQLHFAVIGPQQERPVLLDDTSYFLPCETGDEAHRWAKLLRSEPAQALLAALIFWDAKRPVTAEILRQLDLDRLALDAHLSETIDQPSENAGQGRM